MSNPDDLDDGLLYEYDDAVDAEPIEETEEDQLNDRKRPLENEGVATQENTSIEERGDDNVDESHLSKRQKKLKNSKLHQKKKEQVEYQINQRKSIPKASSEAIVEYLATLIREKNPDLSALELNELYFKKTDFISTEKFNVDRNLVNFPQFLLQFSKAPKSVILSMSNIRVADVYRSVEGNNNAIKLFAKNKLKDDLQSVEDILGDKKSKGEGKDKKKKKGSMRYNNLKYFISTPTRMKSLLESTDAFFQGKDKLDIILDASYLDPKNNSLLSSDNTIVLCEILKLILEKKSSVKILLY
ncbi:hypothetical protein NCAS_0A01440 [Naumovozyma castellii]|uniref:Protein CMS1 n=1 Tax=Naumovozyma castellii TaxID=27288 RepID=G0V5G6_NAUCA|nr:hypothetical protein NCAS_0A01440 [Naumovozyma castellii CBS 4309]CCC66702.1 hypothetical protein NCAS_0A01440 [Naumovozyma castellii CBS 4309]